MLKTSQFTNSVRTFPSISEQIEQSQKHFWEYYPKITEALSILEGDENIDQAQLNALLKNIQNLVALQSHALSGRDESEALKHLQYLSIGGYIQFLIQSMNSTTKTGFIVMPTGQGKTRLALLLAQAEPKKTIIITDNKTNTEQFLEEARKSNIKKNAHKISDTTLGADILITGWHAFHKYISDGLLSDIGTVIVDEADVNGLSDKRQETLEWVSNIHSAKIVAMSATELQASKKELSDFYEYDILRFPMPEGLPELNKLGELPDARFTDFFLDDAITIDRSEDDITEDHIEHYLIHSHGLDQIFQYHLSKNMGKTFVLGVRNNKLNDFIVKKAAEKGIRIVSLTGENTLEERREIIHALRSKEIDGIVGCRLTGRGLDVPECDVVYNALFTRSPQLFWQLFGRALRIDPSNPDKHSDLVTFLPQKVYQQEQDEEERDTTLYKQVLSFRAFFDPKYFLKESRDQQGDLNTSFERDLRNLTEEDIQSMKEVLKLMEATNIYGHYTGRPEVLGDMIRRAKQMNMGYLMKYILRLRSSKDRESFFRDHPQDQDIDREVEYQKYTKMYRVPSDALSLDAEKELVKKYTIASEPQRSQFRDKLLSYHYPIIISLALAVQDQFPEVPTEDLVQMGVERVIRDMEKFRGGYRFSSFCAIRALAEMTRTPIMEYQSIRIPAHIHETLKKIQKLMDTHYTQYGLIPDDDLMAESLQLSTEKTQKLMDILNRKFIWFNEANEEMAQLIRDTDVDIGIEDPTYIKTEHARLRDDMSDVLDGLSLFQSMVLKMRYGIGRSLDMTLEQTGKYIGKEIGDEDVVLSRERIRQVEALSLRKLKHPSRSDRLRTYLNEIGNVTWKLSESEALAINEYLQSQEAKELDCYRSRQIVTENKQFEKEYISMKDLILSFHDSILDRIRDSQLDEEKSNYAHQVLSRIITQARDMWLNSVMFIEFFKSQASIYI